MVIGWRSRARTDVDGPGVVVMSISLEKVAEKYLVAKKRCIDFARLLAALTRVGHFHLTHQTQIPSAHETAAVC